MKKICIVVIFCALSFQCIPEYRAPYSTLIIDTKFSGRGQGFVPSKDNQNVNIIGTGKVLHKGKSCSTSYMYIDAYIFVKGGSIQEAAKSAQIDKIASVDYSLFSFMGIFIKECIIVWGERKQSNEPEITDGREN